MGKFLFLLVCSAVCIFSGYALKCYNCHVEKMDGCTKDAKLASVTCGNPIQGNKYVCYYKTAYDPNRKMNFANSSCEQIPVGSPLDKSSITDCRTPPQGIEIKECRVCDTDLCNSAPVFSTSLISFLSLPIMYLFTKVVLF